MASTTVRAIGNTKMNSVEMSALGVPGVAHHHFTSDETAVAEEDSGSLSARPSKTAKVKTRRHGIWTFTVTDSRSMEESLDLSPTLSVTSFGASALRSISTVQLSSSPIAPLT